MLKIVAMGLLALTLLPATLPQGRQLVISPVRVVLPAAERVASITISNRSPDMADVTISLVGFESTERAPVPLPAETAQLVAVAPMAFRLAAGQSRVVRVARVSRAASMTETSFRLSLVITTGSSAEGQQPTKQAHLLPVFLAPVKVTSGVAMELVSNDGTQVRVRIINHGNTHLRPGRVELAGGTVVGSSWYILPGKSEEIELRLPGADCRATTPTELRFTDGQREARLPLRRSCQPDAP